MSTNLSGNILTLGNSILNEETIKAINSYYHVPNNCKAGDTVILDGIECLCIATGVTIQGSNLTRIAVDKNYDLGYYQKYIRMKIINDTINYINSWRWGGPYVTLNNNSTEIGYGLQNTLTCLNNNEFLHSGGYSSGSQYPTMWKGVLDFSLAHSDKWFVPSLNELLNYVYPYKSSLTFDTNTGGSSTSSYWSSSEYNGGYSYYLNFNNGSTNTAYKYYASRVRLCRAF